MITTIPAIVTESTVSVMLDGQMRVLEMTHPNYDKVRSALKAGASESDILSLIDIAAAVEDFGEGRVTVEHGVVLYDGNALHNTMTDRIISMMREGFNIQPMLMFLENLMENPDFRAVNELYGFLEATDLPITMNGCFRAYKMVTDDYKDHRTGTFDNSIGAVVEMPRNQVNPDKETTCADGLHFCSQGYLGSYGGAGRTVIVEINPRDVVSIPVDYGNAKGRCCRYTVVGEIETENGASVSKDHSFGTSVATVDYGDYVAGDWVSKTTAADILCGNAMDPDGAIRKRISRGTLKTRMNWDTNDIEVQLP